MAFSQLHRTTVYVQQQWCRIRRLDQKNNMMPSLYAGLAPDLAVFFSRLYMFFTPSPSPVHFVPEAIHLIFIHIPRHKP
jgi:hypothetical protein